MASMDAGLTSSTPGQIDEYGEGNRGAAALGSTTGTVTACMRRRRLSWRVREALEGSSEAVSKSWGTALKLLISVPEHSINSPMIRSFRHQGLRRLYERGDPSGIGPDQLDWITLALADLDAASKPSDVDLPGYRLHPLRGDLKGLWSISISGNWRITVRFEDGDTDDVDLVDYHE